MTEKITDTCEHDLYGYKRKIVDAISLQLQRDNSLSYGVLNE